MTQTQQRSVPLFTLDGVHDAEVSTHFITTGDLLGISAFRFLREPSDDVVLLIHGLTTSTDMFIMPEHYNLVELPAGPRLHRRLVPGLPDEQPALLQPVRRTATPWTTSRCTTTRRRST